MLQCHLRRKGLLSIVGVFTWDFETLYFLLTNDLAASMKSTAEPTAPVTITVLFFAAARERANEKSISLTVPAATTAWEAFTDHIIPKYPSLHILTDYCALALNQEYVTRDASQRPLQNRDELAVIPPISGG